MISWITENIAIGEYLDSINMELLEKERIDFVLCVREEFTYEEKQTLIALGIGYIFVPICKDVDKYIYDPFLTSKEEQKRLDNLLINVVKRDSKKAVSALRYFSKCRNKILVHCTAGMDRSPFVVVKYLVDYEGYTYEDAYKLIREKRSFVIEHMEWIE